MGITPIILSGLRLFGFAARVMRQNTVFDARPAANLSGEISITGKALDKPFVLDREPWAEPAGKFATDR